MHLQFTYTFSDYVEANTRRPWLKRVQTIVWIIVAPLFVVGFIIMAIDKSNRYSTTSVVSYLPVLVVFVLMSPWGKRLLIYARWKYQPTLHSVITYEVTPGSVVVTTDTSRTEMKWETFTRFRESKNLFMLYTGRYLFYLIPKRAFSVETDLTEFRELAQSKVATKRGWSTKI